MVGKFIGKILSIPTVPDIFLIVNVFVNPATVSLTIVGGLKQITNILPDDIDVIIDFDLWNSEKQFYSPKIKITDYLIEWKDLSPNK